MEAQYCNATNAMESKLCLDSLLALVDSLRMYSFAQWTLLLRSSMRLESAASVSVAAPRIPVVIHLP